MKLIDIQAVIKATRNTAFKGMIFVSMLKSNFQCSYETYFCCLIVSDGFLAFEFIGKYKIFRGLVFLIGLTWKSYI